ncbi:MAG: hypothetical protein HYX61_07655 [Gammaproteobacteria bacterium]|jgi:hypothetical protein|nr:hypothetical protein [Gammaproteobacteria bacterium]
MYQSPIVINKNVSSSWQVKGSDNATEKIAPINGAMKSAFTHEKRG